MLNLWFHYQEVSWSVKFFITVKTNEEGWKHSVKLNLKLFFSFRGISSQRHGAIILLRRPTFQNLFIYLISAMFILNRTFGKLPEWVVNTIFSPSKLWARLVFTCQSLYCEMPNMRNIYNIVNCWWNNYYIAFISLRSCLSDMWFFIINKLFSFSRVIDMRSAK